VLKCHSSKGENLGRGEKERREVKTRPHCRGRWAKVSKRVKRKINLNQSTHMRVRIARENVNSAERKNTKDTPLNWTNTKRKSILGQIESVVKSLYWGGEGNHGRKRKQGGGALMVPSLKTIH